MLHDILLIAIGAGMAIGVAAGLVLLTARSRTTPSRPTTTPRSQGGLSVADLNPLVYSGTIRVPLVTNPGNPASSSPLKTQDSPPLLGPLEKAELLHVASCLPCQESPAALSSLYRTLARAVAAPPTSTSASEVTSSSVEEARGRASFEYGPWGADPKSVLWDMRAYAQALENGSALNQGWVDTVAARARAVFNEPSPVRDIKFSDSHNNIIGPMAPASELQKCQEYAAIVDGDPLPCDLLVGHKGPHHAVIAPREAR